MTKKKASKKVKIEGNDVPSVKPVEPLKGQTNSFTAEIVDPIVTGDEMNDLAMRIWAGQSVSLPIHERVKRIEARLTEKGYDIATLKLPTDG